MSQQQLGNYNLQRQMGKGQMGSGYRAVQRFEHPDGTITLDTEELVIKVLRKEYALDAAYKKIIWKGSAGVSKIKSSQHSRNP
jgi:hypothetical protein